MWWGPLCQLADTIDYHQATIAGSGLDNRSFHISEALPQTVEQVRSRTYRP
jgi:hypothetical protein